MRFRVLHLLLISTAVCLVFAFPGWISPIELLLIAPVIALVVINLERRAAINYRAVGKRYFPFLIQRGIVGGFVAAIGLFGIVTLLLSVFQLIPNFDVDSLFDRSVSFWVMFGACVAVGYHIQKLIVIGKAESD